ncbi:MAG: RHS repeat-associated core domain-containing protein, partial [Acidobacteriota bacterium]
LMSISGSINSTTESAAYTYDNLGRLVTSNQTTNSVSAQRRFVYDRWGNRTSVYDATSGGNQIQSISLTQSGGAPNNRITSVTSGSTVNYSYDANGNVTNDGVHSYTYDAENRVVSVDSGTTATYAYDQNNCRVKKTFGSSVTHYVWQSGQVLAEHNGASGALIVNYTYLGNRMLNKTESGTTHYFLSDRMSARAVLDTNGNVVGRQAHLPFGEDLNVSGTTDKHKFTSYERDSESGNDYAINRLDNTNVGRFTRVDPLGSSGKKQNPQSWNRYVYTMNDPINMRDPMGLEGFLGIDPLAIPDSNPCRPFGPEVIYDDFLGPIDRFTYCFLFGGLIGGVRPSEPGVSEDDPCSQITLTIRFKILDKLKGDLETCGRFQISIEVNNAPKGATFGEVTILPGPQYRPDVVREFGPPEGWGNPSRTTGNRQPNLFIGIYQVANILPPNSTGNLGIHVKVGVGIIGQNNELVLCGIESVRPGHESDYIAIRGTEKNYVGGWKDCPNPPLAK